MVVDGSKCDGHGICALVFPARVSLDTWGFADVDSTFMSDEHEIARGRRVVRACPAGALTLVADPAGSSGPSSAPRSV